MAVSKLDNFLAKLAQKYKIYAPCCEAEEIFVREIFAQQEIDFSGRLPSNSFKQLFLPSSETIFQTKNNKIKTTEISSSKIAAWGMNILDLQALVLFDLVFSRDADYQARRKNILVIGYSGGIPADYKRYKIFAHNFEENILEHLIFDIFIERQVNGQFKFFTGSREGQKVLEKFGWRDYTYIQFAGAIAEEGPDKKMLQLQQKMAGKFNKKLWQDLGARCIACGKCSIVCPTCFCFDLEYEAGFDSSARKRVWGNCFYGEFSEIAGGIKFLRNVEEKIYFWYYHKFVRIPREYKIPGCVSCHRCTKVCPVGIDITKVLQEL